MLQYGVHPFRDEGCTTCVHYTHHNARCHLRDRETGNSGVYVGVGLSPCGEWSKGYEFIPDSWGQFRKVDAK